MGECCWCGMLDDVLTWIFIDGQRAVETAWIHIFVQYQVFFTRSDYTGVTDVGKSLWAWDVFINNGLDILKMPCTIYDLGRRRYCRISSLHKIMVDNSKSTE